VKYFDLLRIVYRISIDINVHRHNFTLNVEHVPYFVDNHQLLVSLWVDLDIVKIPLWISFMLLEKDKYWVRVSFFLKELREDVSILAIHPMLAFLENVAVFG
jgi:hypothetical protein